MKCALLGLQISFYQASSIHTLSTKPAMQQRKKANTEANVKISIITPKKQQKNARLKRKLNGLKLASRSTEDEISQFHRIDKY